MKVTRWPWVSLAVCIVLTVSGLSGCGGGNGITSGNGPDVVAPSAVLELTSASFRSTILQGQGVALVEFYLPTCSHCRAMAPIVERVATAYRDRALVARIDVGSAPDVAQEQDVSLVPTFVTYRNGAAQDRLVGETAMSTLTGLIDASLATR
jgi:thioredoxin 1